MTTTTAITRFTVDPSVVDLLRDFRHRSGKTNKQLANIFGTSPELISRVINGKLDRDPGDFAARVVDTIKALDAKLDLATTIESNFITEEFAGRVNLARMTQDVAFNFGPAGTGKTCSALKYQLDNPSTIYHKITGRSRSAQDVEAGVFAAMKTTSGHKANQRRWPYMVSTLKGSGIAIIIDNAHRLDRSGRDWGFDFNEETGVAVIFVGNPEMFERVATNDQQQSRIGSSWESSWCIDRKPVADPAKRRYHKTLPDMARFIASQFSDESFADEIADLADYVARRDGAMRSVRKTVILAHKLSIAKKLDPRAAFREAHRNLVRNYMLPLD